MKNAVAIYIALKNNAKMFIGNCGDRFSSEPTPTEGFKSARAAKLYLEVELGGDNWAFEVVTACA